MTQQGKWTCRCGERSYLTLCPRCSMSRPRGKAPSLATMERWMDNGVAKATDGCQVEPDGSCPHGKPSWLLALGYI